MGLIAKDKGGEGFEPIPTGNHHSVCYGVFDLGTQPSHNPNFRAKRQVCITWEIPAERIELEREGNKVNLPRAISRIFGLSLSSKSNLRPFLVSWRGREFTEAELEGFDLKNIIGANCLLNIVHERKGDKTYANVSSVSPLLKNMPKLKSENLPLYFSLDEIPAGQQITFPSGTPDWLKAKVMQSEEWQQRQQGGAMEPPQHGDDPYGESGDDSVPF